MRKRNLIIAGVLVLLTALIAVIYLNGRSQAPKGNLLIVSEGKETLVDPFTLPLSEVKGTTVNGKGEEKEISGEGVSVLDALTLASIGIGDFTSVRIVSSDEYAAELQEDEFSSDNFAFLIKDQAEDGSDAIRLIVFGDSNSKRQVKNVVRIEVTK
ncbi:MAG: hypothetical protein ACSW8K_02920 [bacterium]